MIIEPDAVIDMSYAKKDSWKNGYGMVIRTPQIVSISLQS